MSGTATIAITVGVAVAVLVGFFIVYYLGNVANSIYDVKVGVRKDFDRKVKELQDWVEKDTKQRINWMRDENREEGKRFKESMEGHLEETVGEMEKNIERLRADVTSLQVQLQNLQAGKASSRISRPLPSQPPSTPDFSLPPGDMEIPRPVIMPEPEMAPDMATPAGKSDTTIKDRPTPPPPPASSLNAPKQPAGRTSLEEKAKKKKKRDPEAFETFDQFSDTFKAGKK